MKIIADTSAYPPLALLFGELESAVLHRAHLGMQDCHQPAVKVSPIPCEPCAAGKADTTAAHYRRSLFFGVSVVRSLTQDVLVLASKASFVTSTQQEINTLH